MNFKHKWIIPLLLLITIGLVGCSGKQGKEATNAQQDKQVLSGVYKTDDKYNKTDDGTLQPSYWYFKKNGKLLYCTPQVNSTNQNSDTDFWYGEADRGTWKSLGNNMFELKMHDVYNNNYYTIKAKLNGNKLHTYANSRNAKYEWSADDNYKQPDMTYSDFMDMFNKAKDSDQKDIQENGYAKPDNDSSSNSDDSSNIDPKTLGILILEKARGAESINTGDIEYMIMGKKNDYQIGFGTKDGTLNYVIDGDQVTVRDGSYDYSDDSAKTYSIKDLVNEYYNSSSDKSKVDSVASEVNTTDMSDQ
ncbi:Lreu_0056 family protein [Limosilactobacillus avium]|uniref:Lreu_0056 family protein n=1 Tax=Limosilactobacillus avium TaxID=2991831 RepID=UPI0024BAF66D|nr:hypothetical protein [Limosilactobacillus avium]